MSEPKRTLDVNQPEAERAVLASVLIDPDCFMEVRSILRPADFFDEQNRAIFEAMDKVPAIDQLTISHAAKPGYLSQIISECPTSVNAAYYARMVAKASYQRRLINLSGDLARMAYSHQGTESELYQTVYELIGKARPRAQSGLIGPEEHAERMLERANRERRSEKTISFGYRNLDRWTGGMHPGNLIIIGARPGMGKSQIEQEIATANVDRGRCVLVASAEMSLDEWDDRQIAMECGIPLVEQSRREPTLREMERIQSLVNRTSQRQLHFLAGSLTLANIESQAHYLWETKGLALILVDYVQLLADTVSGDSMREKVGFISRSLKRLARDCECPVVVASQLNRQVEMRPDKRPVLSDLKESGDLEQDTDLALLLHRPEVYKPDDEPGIAHVYIAKQRQGGKVGKLDLKWIGNRYADPDEEVQMEVEL